MEEVAGNDRYRLDLHKGQSELTAAVNTNGVIVGTTLPYSVSSSISAGGIKTFNISYKGVSAGASEPNATLSRQMGIFSLA
ncbi:MAG: hypothetical protein AABZ63_05425 [Actinomycetota bacterium]